MPRDRADWIFIAALTAVVLLVYGLQAPNRGFYGPNHGWTSSHGLAIMSHASPQNLFVGYALQYRGEDGAVQYTYFDRYPPFFSATMHALMSLSDALPVQVALARAAMNAIYIGTVLLAARLAYWLLRDRWLALAAALLAFSGYEMVFYKDMVHYDQPALLGSFLMLLAVARHEAGRGHRWEPYAAALVAVGLGRGYSSLIILGLWALWAFFRTATRGERPLRARLTAGLWTVPARVILVGVVWAAGWIGYNLTVEANQRDISMMQTSIVDSAARRLPFIEQPGVSVLDDAPRRATNDTPAPLAFGVQQLSRLVRWTLPFNWDAVAPEAWLIGLLIYTTGLGYVARLDGARALVAGITGLWGAVWIAVMIDLTHGHEYTMMYAAGALLLFYAALLSTLRERPRLTYGAVGVAFIVFVVALAGVRLEVGNARAAYTYDYDRIRERIAAPESIVHVNISDGECVIEDDFCYVLGFYLSDHFLGAFPIADYVLGRLPTYAAQPVSLPADDTEGLLLMRDTLTPENATAHLFDRAAAERRFIPPDAAPIVTFGENLVLENWSVVGPVNVAPCERVYLESWWLALDSLPANYSLLIAMVDADGNTVTDSNYDLSTQATTQWTPDAFYIDARSLVVPCDTPPGDYPLVMSVYEPGNPPSLDVATPDGTPNGDFFFLTSLVVGVRD